MTPLCDIQESDDRISATTTILSNSIMEILIDQWKFCALECGVNREGFNFKLAMVKTCSSATWPFLNEYALKIIWSVSSDSIITSDPLYSLRERPKTENLSFVFRLSVPWSKCIHRNLKKIIIMFKQKLEIIYLVLQTPRPCFKSQMAVLHFDHCKIKLRFSFLFCPSNRLYIVTLGSEVMVGSDDPLQFF